jgi:hypothetical protein
VWVNIFFGGDTPSIITGEITNLEHDMIEVRIYPDNDVIYINFDYKGIPLDLPIEKFEVRNPPSSSRRENRTKEKKVTNEPEEDEPEEDQVEEEEEAEIEDGNYGDQDQDQDEEDYRRATAKANPNEFIIRANEITFGEDLGPVTQLVDVDESQQRYTIQVQADDMLEELLSQVPINQRTTEALNNIHTVIERFKQLRSSFSEMDKYGNVLSSKKKGALWKPLAKELVDMRTPLLWVLPVVKNTKKVYNISENEDAEYSDVIPVMTSEEIERFKSVVDNYRSNNMPADQNKYTTLMTELIPIFTPFDEVNPEQSDDILYSFHVHVGLNAVVDNLDNFVSSVVKDGIVRSRRFITQQYTTAAESLKPTQLTGTKMIATRSQVGPSDLIELKSLMTLPEPVMRFSRVCLPSANILERTNLSSQYINYWQLLRQKTMVSTVVVDDLVTELDFTQDNFAEGIHSFLLELKDEFRAMEPKARYEKFLNAVVPRTRVLFNIMQKHIQGKLSLKEVVNTLEPFLVYQDDMTYFQYKEMRLFLQEKISDYNRQFVERSRVFSVLKRITALSMKPSPKQLTDLVTDYALKKEVFEVTYLFDSDITVSEGITFIVASDFGNVFNYVVAQQNMNLMLSSDVTDLIEEQRAIIEESAEAAAARNTCNDFVVAKQYSNMQELTEDNGKAVFFDRKYDDTPYKLLEEFEKEQIQMDPAAFLTFLVGKLKSKYKYKQKDAKYIADNVVNGVKKIRDGNVAIVFVPAEDKVLYFRRKNNRWEADSSINENSFNATNQSMLCNFQDTCIEVNKQFGSQCDSVELNKKELEQKALTAIVDEFDKNYQISKQEIEANVNKKLDYYMGIVNKINEIEYHRVYKYNNKQYAMGNERQARTKRGSKTGDKEPNKSVVHEDKDKDKDEDEKEKEKADDDTVSFSSEVSPYANLRDLILGQSDFIKKQSDIVRFVKRFARTAVDDESPHWLYCVQTGAKLLPVFLNILASQFVEDPSRFVEKMDQIIQASGALSDDGDAWVDKNSGYVIRKRDYDADEGFEEGFRVSSRAILEQDAGDALLRGVNETKGEKPVKFQTREVQLAANVMSAFASNMGLVLDGQREFILKVFSDTLPTALPSKSDYKAREKEMAQKGKNIPSYEKIYNGTILYLTMGALLIGLQTSIPSVKTRKTFPGCVRSFVGYPFDGDGDMSSLAYLCCIAEKLKKTDSEPWTGLAGVKQTSMVANTKHIIDTYFLSNVDVEKRFADKTTYLLETPTGDDIPEEHNLKQWHSFLPPLVAFRIKKTESITSQFKTALFNDMKTGAKDQHDKLMVVESKIILFSLAVQDQIQRIITKKKLLLANSSNEPFIENACCTGQNQSEGSVLTYFEQADPEISRFVGIVSSLSDMMTDVHHISKGCYFFSRENTKNIYPPLTDEFKEETIYRAFISLCKFTSYTPLSPELLAICNEKPTYLGKFDTIAEKIRKLKEDGRIYNNDALLRLLQVVGRQNAVALTFYDVHGTTPIQRMKEVLELIEDDEEEEVIAKALVQNMNDVMDSYDVAVEEDTDQMRNLKNYLGRSNRELKAELFAFLVEHGSLSKKEKTNIKTALDNLTVWEDLNPSAEEEGDTFSISNDALYNAVQFLLSYLDNIVSTFPNIIMNGVDYRDVRVPAYLGLSKRHSEDIKGLVSKYYHGLSGFFKDPKLSVLLVGIQQTCANLVKLAHTTPAFSDITIGGGSSGRKKEIQSSIFDARTSLLLCEHYFLLAMKEYVKLAGMNRTVVRTSRPTASFYEGDNDDEESGDDDRMLTTVEYEEDAEQRMIYAGASEAMVARGNVKELEDKTAKLLVAFLQIMTTHKNTVDFSHQSVMDLVFKTKEREKDTFTDRLKQKSQEELNVDTILKVCKLGDWGKGLQRGLTSYVKDDYDNEREYFEGLAQVERKVMRNKDASERNANLFMDDEVEASMAAQQIEDEENNIGFLTEDYMDGDYQGGEEENYDDYD